MRYFFTIRRKHGAALECVAVDAKDSQCAVRTLPPCVSWDFCRGELWRGGELLTQSPDG